MTETRGTVLVALGANLLVALAKAAGGLVSGSAALLSEAAHSVADTLNELFLLLSLRTAERPADRTHPFGYGKERFFWSLLAAVGIFVSGAGYSLYEGLKAVRAHDRVPSTQQFLVVYAVLLVSLAAEAASLRTAVKQLRRQARSAGRSPLDFVRRSPDPTVKTVASEDSAAVVGVVVALAGTVLHQVTGAELWDGVASLVIAALLAYVAFVLGRDTKELLIGEAADPAVRLRAYAVLRERPEVVAVKEVLTMQLGPSAVLVAARLQFEESLTAGEVADVCTSLAEAMQDQVPSVSQVFLDPSRVSEREVRALHQRAHRTAQEMASLDGEQAVQELRSRTARRARDHASRRAS